MTLRTIARDKYESYFAEMVCYARPDERDRREKWQGADHVFFFETNNHTDEIAEVVTWLATNDIRHFICRSNVYTFIELPSEADATMFWIRFKT
jgi:hypothetical protein